MEKLHADGRSARTTNKVLKITSNTFKAKRLCSHLHRLGFAKKEKKLNLCSDHMFSDIQSLFPPPHAT